MVAADSLELVRKTAMVSLFVTLFEKLLRQLIITLRQHILHEYNRFSLALSMHKKLNNFVTKLPWITKQSPMLPKNPS